MTPIGSPVRQLDLLFEDPAQVRRIWTVRDVVERVRALAEEKFSDVWVEGEVSNLRMAPSGHVYFTLKDAEAQLPIILFRRQALLLRFRPVDGLRLLARGRISVYSQRGQLQLVAETLEPVGTGSLQLAFEQLKQRLKAEGLFEFERKKPLPAFPKSVGIVTSPSGAVIQDFLNIVSRRNSALSVLLYPVAVQGDSAPSEIQEGIASLNASGLVELIVVARGGGSLEDLAAFNSEEVARSISTSKLPVVSAVGHETDFTISDFVADLRAPTPSAAAELITESQNRVVERVVACSQRLERAARYLILQARQRVESLHVERAEWSMTSLLNRMNQRLDECILNVESILDERLKATDTALIHLTMSLLRYDPRRQSSVLLEQLQSHRRHMQNAMGFHLQRASASLSAIDARLRILSPLAVLDRGYAVVSTGDGILIRSAMDVVPGQRLMTRLKDGSIASIVEDATSVLPKRSRNTKSK